MAQGTTKGVPIDIDGTLSNNSDLLVASQKATKTYVDNGLLLKQDTIGYTPVNKGGDTMLGNLILNANPTLPLQAATKDYIDTLINGIDWKQAATAGTVSALPTYAVTGSGQILTGTSNGAIPSATTDGVTLIAGNRVLVKNETSTLAPNNGIYIVTQVGSGSTPFILTRSDDANTPSEIAEATLSVNGGSTLSNTQWHCNPASVPVVIGTTNITFAQIGSGTYTAGSGLSLAGNVFSVATNGVTDAMIQSATNWNTAYSSRITTANAPLSISSNTISITQATNSVDGYLSSTDWTTFNSKQGTITLTTTGTSGSSTFISNTLNIPTYTLSGLGGVPTSRTLTINGTAYDLSLDRSWSVGTVTSVAALTIGTSGTDITSSVVNSSTTPVITLNVPTASATNRGALSSTDWSTFNGKQDAITLTTTGTSGAATLVGATLNIPQYQSVLTNPVTGTGTTNEISYWTSSSAIGSLSTTTYPSLTELSYVKGVTSSIQTQFSGKQDTLTLTTTGTSGAATLVGSTLNIPQYSGGGGGMAIGGSITSATAGSVLFAGTSGVLQQNNANFFWDDTNNRLGVGLNTPSTQFHILTLNAATTVRGLFIEQKTVDANGGTLSFGKSRATGAATSGDTLVNIFPHGWDGTQYISGGRIRFTADGAVSAGSVPTAFELYTGSSGSGTVRLTISSGGTSTFAGQITSTLAGSTTTGGGQLYLNGATSNRIDFNTNGFAAPAFTTRSAGTKIVLFPAVDATNVDYAIGIEGSTQWYSIPQATGSFLYKWYAGTTNILQLTGAGVMTLSRNQNSNTTLVISNTTSGTAAQSYIQFSTDATAGVSYIGKRSNTFTATGIINAADMFIENSTKGDIAINNGFASGAIKFAAGASTTAQLTLSSAGALTQSVNQSNPTIFTISNTTSSATSDSKVLLTSDASSGSAAFGKYSTTTTTNKIVTAGDCYIYNATAGDIAILNDFASGAIVMAAGGSSTAQVTIGTTGLTTFATGVDYKRLNPTTTTAASTATLTPDISLGDIFTITAQAVALSVANPTGTPVNGQKMIIRIEDNGTARAISWSTGTAGSYRASSDLALPTTTIAARTVYLGFIWNSTDSRWDLLALLNNFA